MILCQLGDPQFLSSLRLVSEESPHYQVVSRGGHEVLVAGFGEPELGLLQGVRESQPQRYLRLSDIIYRPRHTLEGAVPNVAVLLSLIVFSGASVEERDP